MRTYEWYSLRQNGLEELLLTTFSLRQRQLQSILPGRWLQGGQARKVLLRDKDVGHVYPTVWQALRQRMGYIRQRAYK